MYRYIFFDLDGTLTDSREGIINGLRYAFETMGMEPPPEAQLLHFIGPPLEESFRNRTTLSPEERDRAIDLFRGWYNPIAHRENREAPGAAELLQRLKEQGLVLALASSKPEALCRAICDRFGFTPALAVLAGSPPERDTNKAGVIRIAMERLGLTEEDRHQILMVGDRKYDVWGAAECGIDCVGVEFFGYNEPGELEAAGAVAVVHTMEELERWILSRALES